MRPPPRHIPRTLAKQFAADPFDRRMHAASAGREHTPLGLLVEIVHWYRTHQAECGPAFGPIVRSAEECLRREAPDALADLATLEREP